MPQRRLLPAPRASPRQREHHPRRHRRAAVREPVQRPAELLQLPVQVGAVWSGRRVVPRAPTSPRLHHRRRRDHAPGPHQPRRALAGVDRQGQDPLRRGSRRRAVEDLRLPAATDEPVDRRHLEKRRGDVVARPSVRRRRRRDLRAFGGDHDRRADHRLGEPRPLWRQRRRRRRRVPRLCRHVRRRRRQLGAVPPRPVQRGGPRPRRRRWRRRPWRARVAHRGLDLLPGQRREPSRSRRRSGQQQQRRQPRFGRSQRPGRLRDQVAQLRSTDPHLRPRVSDGQSQPDQRAPLPPLHRAPHRRGS